MKSISLLALVLFGNLTLFAADEPAREAAETKTETKTEATTTAPAAADAKAVDKTAEKKTSTGGFTGQSLEVKKYLEDLFEVSKKVNSTVAAEKSQARSKIETALDWDTIAKECLGDASYKKQSAKNLTEFKTILKDVIVKTAYTRLDKFWNGTTVKIDKINLKGNNAHVPAKFTVNGSTEVLDYYLQQKNGKWSIVDVAYEQLRYSVNIHEQLDAFLRENSFANLLDKLRKRRQELTADTESAGKKG